MAWVMVDHSLKARREKTSPNAGSKLKSTMQCVKQNIYVTVKCGWITLTAFQWKCNCWQSRGEQYPERDLERRSVVSTATVRHDFHGAFSVYIPR